MDQRNEQQRFSNQELTELQLSLDDQVRRLAMKGSKYNIRALLDFVLNGTEMSAEDATGVVDAMQSIHRLDAVLSATTKVDVEIRRREVYGE